MPALTPEQAVKIAKYVYEIRNLSLNDAAEQAGGLGINGLFNLNHASRFHGASGPTIINKRSGFGYIAKGINHHKDEALIALRGTQFTHLYDVWTDANIGVQKGPGGWPVHAGFNDTFNSIKAELLNFFVKNNPSHVHCIGHSLGGALATLVADYLSELGVGEISLYTLGCPRIGNAGFTKNLTDKITADNIYRVYHNADVVSMIPIFPFFHTPDPGLDIPLDWRWSPISLLAHKMKFYTRQIENNNSSSWRALKGQAAPAGWYQDARFWLETAATQGDFMYSARTLRMIGSALAWIVDQAVRVTGIATKASITVLDRLAWLLHQGALASKDLAIGLTLVIRKIFQFLGRPWINGAKLSVAFVRWTLDLLLSAARSFAYRALTGVEFY